MVIEGVPQSIKRSDLIAVLQTLGFDPSKLVSMRFSPKFLEIDVFYEDSDKKRCFDDSEKVAMHSLMVPIAE